MVRVAKDFQDHQDHLEGPVVLVLQVTLVYLVV